MEDMPISLIPNPAIMDIKFGFDGSGNHAIYRQLNNEKTNNIIMTMFCPLALKSESGEAKWSQKSPNSALTHRPLALQLGRESSKTLQSLTVFDEDINKMKSVGCKVKVGDLEIPLKVNVASHMMDMKAAKIYLGLGGAYCDLCETSKEDCHDTDIVGEGVDITRNVEDLKGLFNDLGQDDGSVWKAPHDYGIRKGLTAKPIPDHEVTSVQVLHSLLRAFDHYMKIAVHLRAAVFVWSESPTSRSHQLLKKVKAEIQEKIENEIGEKWDYPGGTGNGGTTTTGNTARRLLHDEKGREIIVQMLPEKYQQVMRQIGQYLSVILRLFSSSKTIDVTEYRKLCTTLYLLYLQSFPSPHNTEKQTWISITPSLHKLLGHSWELIELNADCGLKNFDETGLEANNKILRLIRLKLARKTSQTANLHDVINRLWLGSDPKVNNICLKTQPYCKNCCEYGHSSRYCKQILQGQRISSRSTE